MSIQVYLASTLDLMYKNKLEDEVNEIINKSECNKILNIIYFKIKEETKLEEDASS